MKQSFFLGRFGSVLLGAVCLCAFSVRAEKMVAVNADGELLDMGSSRNRALVKEKVRILTVKKQAVEKKLLPEKRVKEIYQPIIEPNKDQYKTNLLNAKRFRARAINAKEQDQMEAAQNYMKVAKLFLDYSEQNKAIVQAFANGSSGGIAKACEEILKIEKQIKSIARRDVPRKWFTPQELGAIRIMPAKQYDELQRDDDTPNLKKDKNKPRDNGNKRQKNLKIGG